ncbi:hypothetical protein ACFVYP_21360 [Kitasatospora sp. NPDC058201]|uniref:hypothetical protein n=1 Tax=Streptomycetaceae TaxID=2062 RepID=UPI002E7A4CC1|nr:hypothetical protein [Streptomyces sp. BE303]MED7954464.1 hypothetical protein [Streptomyces sp. BE303]
MTQVRPDRPAGGIAVAWGAVLLGWAAYNCFWQAGVATFVKGIFYYGSDAVTAETGSLNYGLLYLVSGVLLLRGHGWARGVAVGVALVEGYNRVRSLTGALLDEPQRRWFTGTTEGWLKLVTFGLGVLVTAVLVLLLVRSLRRPETGREPAPGPWAAQSPFPGQTFPGQPPFGGPVQQHAQHAQPHAQQAPAAWAPQAQPYPQPQPQAHPQPYPHEQPTQTGWPQPQPQPYASGPAAPQQPWPAPPVAPGPVTPGPVAPGQVRPPQDTPPYPG